MEWYKWVFDGIGVALITFIIGLFSYKKINSKNIKQKQISNKNSQQIQIGNLDYTDKNCNIDIKQEQIANNNSIQFQIGNKHA